MIKQNPIRIGLQLWIKKIVLIYYLKNIGNS